MKALLPVAGNGTRMFPLGATTPKCLIPILNKPLLVWSVEALRQNGITEVVLVISAGEFGKKIRDFVVATQDKPGLAGTTIQLAVQEQQLGTAHVVQMAESFFEPGEEFIFLYGDDLYGPGNITQIVATPGLAVTGQKVSDPEKWGIFEVDEQRHLRRVIEKPTQPVGDLANIGCMKLNTRIFELYDQVSISPRGEYELTDSLMLLAKEQPISVLETADYWIPIGYPWHILEATEYFLKDLQPNIQGKVEEGVHIEGNVVLPASSTIKSGTRIEGNVLIGENVVIGPNAYLRGNITIGHDSKVGFSVEIKNAVIGNQTFIPHLSYIGDSILGNNVNFAGQSMAANWRHDAQTVKTVIKDQLVDTGRVKFGTVIGDNVKLGVGTLIYPGRKIWPDTTTRPGQVLDKDLVR